MMMKRRGRNRGSRSDVVTEFGITSATAIFEWYSSAAQYIAERTCALKHVVHYVDDFMMLIKGIDAAKLALESVIKLFAELGIPMSRSSHLYDFLRYSVLQA